MKFVIVAGVAAMLLASCASHTGIVPVGNDAYMIAKQQATGFPGLGNMKAEVLAEGSSYCTGRDRQFELVSSSETQPPYILGNYPRVEIQFICRDKRTTPTSTGATSPRNDPSSNRPAPQTQSTSSTGSGVFVSPDGLVLTAEHVIRGGKHIEVLTQDGRRFRARVQSASRSLDLAVLSTDSTPLVFLPVRLARPTPGARVFTVGFPLPGVLGQEPKISDGIVNANSGIRDDAGFMQISIPLQPGNSGGPVVTEQGILVGVVTSSAAIAPFLERTGTIPQNVNWAVHSSLAITLLGKEGPPQQTRTREQSIVDTLRAAVLILVQED